MSSAGQWRSSSWKTTPPTFGSSYGNTAISDVPNVALCIAESEKLDVVLWEKNHLLTKVYNQLPVQAEKIIEDYLGYAERLRPHVADTGRMLHDALSAGRNVMLEGAQGTMLDLDHGTYPFVTSSTPVAGYALASAGIGPHHVERVIGITKAYVTRVGSGPFPTEALDADGERMGERGHEFGTTTGRKRRCGWFDACVLRYAARLNGLSELVLTKLDVLSGFETLKVCVPRGAMERNAL